MPEARHRRVLEHPAGPNTSCLTLPPRPGLPAAERVAGSMAKPLAPRALPDVLEGRGIPVRRPGGQVAARLKPSPHGRGGVAGVGAESSERGPQPDASIRAEATPPVRIRWCVVDPPLGGHGAATGCASVRKQLSQDNCPQTKARDSWPSGNHLHPAAVSAAGPGPCAPDPAPGRPDGRVPARPSWAASGRMVRLEQSLRNPPRRGGGVNGAAVGPDGRSDTRRFHDSAKPRTGPPGARSPRTLSLRAAKSPTG